MISVCLFHFIFKFLLLLFFGTIGHFINFFIFIFSSSLFVCLFPLNLNFGFLFQFPSYASLAFIISSLAYMLSSLLYMFVFFFFFFFFSPLTPKGLIMFFMKIAKTNSLFKVSSKSYT